MTLTVHVGAHKTASTHLQQSIRSVTRQLAEAGVFYADGLRLRGRLGALDVAIGTGARAARHREALQRRMDRLSDAFAQIVLSEENILGTIKPDNLMGADNLVYPHAAGRLSRLSEALRERPMTVMLAVREPVSFLSSAFLMRLQGGRDVVWSEFVGDFRPSALSWTGLARRLLAVPSTERLVVWRYEDYAALRPHLLERVIPEPLLPHAANPPRALVGLSKAAYREIIERLGERGADVVQVATEAKAAHPRPAGEAAPLLADKAMRVASAAAYAEDMRTLAALPGVELLRP